MTLSAQSDSLTNVLAKYKEMYSKGLITQQEYDILRQKALGLNTSITAVNNQMPTKTYPDSVKVPYNTYVMCRTEKELNASQYKAGDTLNSFTVAEDVFINDASAGKLRVISKGANVIAIVKTAVLPHKLDASKMWTGDSNAGPMDMRVGGELSVEFVSVEAVDGSFIKLGDCILFRYGGENGGYTKDVIAFMPANTQKSCQTKWPGATVRISSK